jgi:hypothetical protein
MPRQQTYPELREREKRKHEIENATKGSRESKKVRERMRE